SWKARIVLHRPLVVAEPVGNYQLDRVGLKLYTVGPVGKQSLRKRQFPTSMTKRDLVIRISNETGLVQQQVLDVVQKTLDYISEAVAKGRKVELRNFGVFEVKIRKARVGRNPNDPETDVPIPKRAVVKFKPGKDMREEVIKLTPEQVEAAAKAQAEEEKQRGPEDHH